MLFRLALVLCAAFCVPAAAVAADYYVSPAGNDSRPGTSTADAWQTLARVNAARLATGDRVLLQGGATFAGQLVFDALDGGTESTPLIVRSFGAGRARLQATASSAIFVYNRAAIHIAALEISGSNAAGSSGIVIYTDTPAAAPHAGVTIEDTDVGGFGQDGIQIGAWSGAPGFSAVRVLRSSVHDNGRTGLLTFADRPAVHRDVYVGYVRAFDNRGIPGQSVNTGSGIVLGGVNGGTIERSVAYGNGSLSTAGEGPVGIWTYDSTRIVIQYNESFANRTGGPADGGGFDLDQNVTDSVVQFNYSHDNDGAGFLLAHAYATDAHRGNVVRFNISQHDGRRNGYGGIEIWGRTLDAAIYHNTVVTSPAASGTPRAIRITNSGISGVRSRGVRVLNNILVTTGSVPLVWVSADQLTAAPVVFAGNHYEARTAFLVAWGSTTYSSLTAFRNAGQEQVSGLPAGGSGDAGLGDAGGAPALNNADLLDTLAAYRLRDAAPVRDRGVPLGAFGLAPGARDFFGNALAGTPPDPGAHEWTAFTAAPAEPVATPQHEIVVWAADAATTRGNWSIVSDPDAAGGARLQNINRGAPKVAAAASPADYFEVTVYAHAGVPYRLWLRGRAERNHYSNDSVYVQFSDAVDAEGRALFPIHSTSAASYVLEDCSGCGVSGWGWHDNGYGLNALGPLIYFRTAGAQTLRVQPREDGLGIDQIVLSSARYLSSPPGQVRNDATILPSSAGTAAAPQPLAPLEPLQPADIVLWAADGPAIAGNWAIVADTSAAGGARVQNPNRSQPKVAMPASQPADFFELSFTAVAGVPYRLWIRGIAQGNSYANDSVYVQFSGAVASDGTAINRIGTASAAAVVLEECSGCGVSGWGWQDNGYGQGVLGPEIYFASSGPQTIRIQRREDGLGIDQILLTPVRWLTIAPGSGKDDATIVPRP